MPSAKSKPVIGLLGGIGAGKSTVAAELVALGCGLVDADAIGHGLLNDPAVKAELRKRWGDGVMDAGGNVDRSAVSRVVFDSPEELAALNAVMHPRIRGRMVERVAALQADPAVAAVVVDAALLLETDWHEQCTHFVFVSAPEQERARRVRRVRGWDRATWKRRENSQKPLDIKAAKAEYVVDNSSSVSRLREQVRSVFHRIVHAADRPWDRC
jgi:dephospho-CoA kinase